LGDKFSENLQINNAFRVWFLAPLMLSDGYTVKFNPDHSFESEALHMVTEWSTEGTELVLVDKEDRRWIRFKYSSGCGTLVNEYEYASTPQVTEIGIVK